MRSHRVEPPWPHLPGPRSRQHERGIAMTAINSSLVHGDDRDFVPAGTFH